MKCVCTVDDSVRRVIGRGFMVDVWYGKRGRGGVDLKVAARLWLTRQIPMVRADSKRVVFSGVR